MFAHVGKQRAGDGLLPIIRVDESEVVSGLCNAPAEIARPPADPLALVHPRVAKSRESDADLISVTSRDSLHVAVGRQLSRHMLRND